MHWQLVVLRLLYAVAMLFLPGYLVARLARFQARFFLAFPLSSIILFCIVFWLHADGFSLTFINVAAIELAVCAVLAGLINNQSAPRAPAIRAGWRTWDGILLLYAGVMVLLLAWRSLMSPLAEFDTYFRWDFLARQILAFGRYDFYPPRTPADFHKYFYAESIPPMVSFTYWWLYAAVGATWSRLTTLPVLLQYLSVLGLVFHVARHVGGNRAASFAVAALASSSLFFNAVAMAEETGLTALALAGLLFALCLHGSTLRGCVLAGAMAALAAMSREYGWAYLLIGCVALVPFSGKRAAIFILTALLLAGPWYARTWWLTGNPFYSMRFFGMTVNPVLSAILKFYRQNLGISTWTFGNWVSVAAYLFQTALVPCTLGIIGLVILLRKGRSDIRYAAVLAIAVIIVVALWLYSVGETSGGPWYSVRVLSPAVVVLSITSGIAFAATPRPFIAKMILTYAVICALIAAWLYPLGPLSVSPRKWLAFGLTPWIHTERAEQVVPLLSQGNFSPSRRILSSDAVLYATLLRDGYTVTPPWSPDVYFLFDPQVNAAESRRRLIALGIAAVEFDPDSLNTVFLDRNSKFFHEVYHDPRGYRPLIHLDNWGILLLRGAK